MIKCKLNWKGVFTTDSAGRDYGKKLDVIFEELDKWYARFYVLWYLVKIYNIKELEYQLSEIARKLRQACRDEAMLVIVDDIIGAFGEYNFDKFAEIAEEHDIDLVKASEEVLSDFCNRFPDINWADTILQKLVVFGIICLLFDNDFLAFLNRTPPIKLDSYKYICSSLGLDVKDPETFSFFAYPTMADLLYYFSRRVLSDKYIGVFEKFCRMFLDEGVLPRILTFTLRTIDFLKTHSGLNDIIFVDSFIGLTHYVAPVAARFGKASRLVDRLVGLADRARRGDIQWLWNKYKSDIVKVYPEVHRYRYLFQP